MRRIAIWASTTVTVLVLLFGYHTSTSGPTATDVFASTTAGTGTTGGSTAGGSTTAARTVTGTVAQTRWGPVQVALTVTDGSITGVAVPQYPTGNNRDQEINARALPILVEETMSAQSAQVDMVSGATVTSAGYLESLQSAIDQAGL